MKLFCGERFYVLALMLLLTCIPVYNQLYINEILSSNNSINRDRDFLEYGDWIELYNAADHTVDLAGYSVSDNPSQPDKWVFKFDTRIESKSYLLLWADDYNTSLIDVHLNFKLDREGEFIGLYSPAGELIDSVSFSLQEVDISYGRSEDGGAEWSYFSRPTPGLSNSNAGEQTLSSPPVPSLPGGFYDQSVLIEVSSDADQYEIFYTLDGSDPGQSSTRYVSPFPIENTKVLKLICKEPGKEPSKVLTNTYLINENKSLPVISLSTDPANLWDNETGIYVRGTNGITGNCSDVPVNWNQDWERPFYLEYFDKKKKLLENGFGVKIFGGCSRGFDQKSLAFYTRKEYGYSRLDYNFFPDKDITYLNNFVLRNSGNDWQYTMLRDGYMQNLLKNTMDIDWQAYQPAIVFLNGEYWGIHNIREKLNEHYIKSNYRLEPEEIDFVEHRGNFSVLAGSTEGYESFLDYIVNEDITDPAVYTYVKSQMDVNEYINYLTAQIYFGNDDWPGNNIKFWRPHYENGRWRWIIYDTDFGLGLYGGSPSENTLAFALQDNGPDWPNPPWSTLLFRTLIENEDFKTQFIQQFSAHLGSTFEYERTMQVLDSITLIISDEMPAHLKRWFNQDNTSNWENNLSVLRNYLYQRSAYILNHFKNYFGLPGMGTVSIINDSLHQGNVLVNQVPANARYKGEFFYDIPLKLNALLNSGYQIDYWKVKETASQKVSIINRNAEWKYWDRAEYPGEQWFDISFDDTDWPSGHGELGYGDGNEETVLSYGDDESNKRIAYYFRRSFTVENPEQIEEIKLNILRDDGIIVYLNGTEIVRDNMPAGEVDHYTFASNYVGGDDESAYFEYTISQGELLKDNNILAVELHQSSGTSSDIGFDLEISALSVSNSSETRYEGNNLELFIDGSIEISPVFKKAEGTINLKINEFLTANDFVIADEWGEYSDYIELYNPTDFAIDIGGMFITDNPLEPEKYRMPDTVPSLTTIQPKGFLLLWADNDSAKGPLHVGFKLNSKIGTVGLGWDGNDFLDRITYGEQTADISFGRYPDGSGNLENFKVKTPGETNVRSVPTIQSPLEILSFNAKIYPNPAGEVLNIKFIDAGTFFTPSTIDLKIYSLTGQLIFHDEVRNAHNEYPLDVRHLNKGMYILQVKAGDQTEAYKFIKD